MTSIYERNMYLYYHIYKVPTIAASQDCNINHFVYLEKVDKISITSNRHLYCSDNVIQSKIIHIDSPISPNSKKTVHP